MSPNQLGYDPNAHRLDVMQALGRIHLPLSRMPGTRVDEELMQDDFALIPDAQRCVVEGLNPFYGCGETVAFRLVVMTKHGILCRSGIVPSRINCSVMPQVARALSFPDPKPQVECIQPGTLEITFVCAFPCIHELFLSIDGAPIPSCPPTFTVTPGRAHAARSVVTGPADPIQRGFVTAIVVTTADEFGHLCVNGGDLFGFKAIGDVEITEVIDENNGQYVCKCAVHQGPVGIEVLLNGVPIAHSPWFPTIMEEAPESKLSFAATTTCDPQSLVAQLQRDEVPIPQLPHPPRSDEINKTPEKSSWLAAMEWQKLWEARQEMGECRDSLLKRQHHLAHLCDLLRHESLLVAERAHQTILDKEDAELIEKRLTNFREELSLRSQKISAHMDKDMYERVYSVARHTQAKIEELEKKKVKLEFREAQLDNRDKRKPMFDLKEHHRKDIERVRDITSNIDYRHQGPPPPVAIVAPNVEHIAAFRRGNNMNNIVDNIGKAPLRKPYRPLDKIPRPGSMSEKMMGQGTPAPPIPAVPYSPRGPAFGESPRPPSSSRDRSAPWSPRDRSTDRQRVHQSAHPALSPPSRRYPFSAGQIPIPMPPEKPPNLPTDAKIRDIPPVHNPFANAAGPSQEWFDTVEKDNYLKRCPASSLDHIGYAMEDLFESYALEGRGGDKKLEMKNLYRMLSQAGVPLLRQQFEQAMHDAKVPQAMTFDEFVEALIGVAAATSPLETQSQAVADLFSYHIIPLYDSFHS
eukprot:GEMP01008147.1.p1 GENE.GEMP01008147.1~~GEMP01008147.1.p1  ORF type:complete len:748 (+),score=182.22 GEMP01008147.1:58-2301(+)